MRRLPVFYLAVICLFPLLPLLPAAAYAESERELVREEKNLEDINKKLRETESSVKEMARKEKSILGEMEVINRDLVKKKGALRRVNASLKKAKGNIAETDENIAELTREREELSERLTLRLRAMYKMRKGGALGVLFASGSSRGMGARHKYLTMIMESDSALLEKSAENLRRLEGEKERLGELREDLSSKMKTASIKKGEAERTRKKKKRLLRDIKRKKEGHLELMAELEAAQKKLGELIEGLKTDEGFGGVTGKFASMKGRLDMPVGGKVVSFYGKVKHPRFKTVTFNNGIVIEAPFASEVRSVYTGKVAYVGWLKGYGQVMILDHGGAFYTLFAHLHKMLKERGDTVETGEVVGLVGESGTHEAAGLYFEIRQKGVPRDPMAWMAKK
ncbi:MAG: peptidoglycan DD-metalloendopeptidase family protein [Thermodesulfobacteriota bacterium]